MVGMWTVIFFKLWKYMQVLLARLQNISNLKCTKFDDFGGAVGERSCDAEGFIPAMKQIFV